MAKFTARSAASEQVVEDVVVGCPGEVELDFDDDLFLLFPFFSRYLNCRRKYDCEWIFSLDVARIGGGESIAGRRCIALWA